MQQIGVFDDQVTPADVHPMAAPQTLTKTKQFCSPHLQEYEGRNPAAASIVSIDPTESFPSSRSRLSDIPLAAVRRQQRPHRLPSPGETYTLLLSTRSTHSAVASPSSQHGGFYTRRHTL